MAAGFRRTRSSHARISGSAAFRADRHECRHQVDHAQPAVAAPHEISGVQIRHKCRRLDAAVQITQPRIRFLQRMLDGCGKPEVLQPAKRQPVAKIADGVAQARRS